MKHFINFLKLDSLLLIRYQIITISLFITAVYTLLFKWLSTFAEVDKILVVVIFNDPALLGFLFIGVMVLFEKNENTLQALAVSPIKIEHYILSKSAVLTAISLVCCYAMAIAAHGLNFNFIHFGLATIISTLIFCFIGFIAVAGQSNFNKYLLILVVVLIPAAIPFLGYFDVVSKHWFYMFPTQPCIYLYSNALGGNINSGYVLLSYSLGIIWCIALYFYALSKTKKSLAAL